MKLKVYIKYFSPGCKIADFAKGDWIDLKAAEPIRGFKGELFYIPLGVAMVLPHGFEAIVAPRSSTPKNFGSLFPTVLVSLTTLTVVIMTNGNALLFSSGREK